MSKFGKILSITSLILGTSCVSYKKQASDFLPKYEYQSTTEISQKTREKTLKHYLYDIIPYQREQMQFYDIRHFSWYLFGNEHDGIFGERMSLENPYNTNINFSTFCSWQLRNPLHNVFYYPPLGSACFDKHVNLSLFRIDKNGINFLDKDFSGVFGKGNFSFKINLNDFKPFFSLKIKEFETYLGWRERGNLGASLRIHRKKKE